MIQLSANGLMSPSPQSVLSSPALTMAGADLSVQNCLAGERTSSKAGKSPKLLFQPADETLIRDLMKL